MPACRLIMEAVRSPSCPAIVQKNAVTTYTYHGIGAKLYFGGRWGVSVFFVLSGFVLVRSYWERPVEPTVRNAFAFSAGKIKKLFPLHVLMLLAGLLGLLASISAFDRMPLRPLWLLPLLSALAAAAGELFSLVLGRGLWYSAIFVVLFGLALFPLGLGTKKGANL